MSKLTKADQRIIKSKGRTALDVFNLGEIERRGECTPAQQHELDLKKIPLLKTEIERYLQSKIKHQHEVNRLDFIIDGLSRELEERTARLREGET